MALGLALVSLGLGPSLRGFALGLALLVLRLTLALEVRIVGGFADLLLDLALRLFENTHAKITPCISRSLHMYPWHARQKQPFAGVCVVSARAEGHARHRLSGPFWPHMAEIAAKGIVGNLCAR